MAQLRDVYKNLLKHYESYTEKEHDAVIERGGLHVIGTERHESRRVDNQLRAVRADKVTPVRRAFSSV